MSEQAPLVEELTAIPDPLDTCVRFADLPYVLLFDSAASPERLGRYSFLAADPTVVVRSKNGRTERADWRTGGRWSPVAADPLDAVRELLAPYAAAPVPGRPPVQGGAAGYIGYDWGARLERIPPPRYDDLAVPDVLLGLYDWVIAWDHQAGRAWIISTGLPDRDGARRAAARLEWVRRRLRGQQGFRPRLVRRRQVGRHGHGAQGPGLVAVRQTARRQRPPPRHPQARGLRRLAEPHRQHRRRADGLHPDEQGAGSVQALCRLRAAVA